MGEEVYGYFAHCSCSYSTNYYGIKLLSPAAAASGTTALGEDWEEQEGYGWSVYFPVAAAYFKVSLNGKNRNGEGEAFAGQILNNPEVLS